MRHYQPDMLEYPSTKFGGQNRRFQKKMVSEIYWLEYSPSTIKTYCFYYFLFLNDVNSSNISALVNEGFDNWKRVNQRKTCAFFAHIGSAAFSLHTICGRMAENLMRPSQHIDKVMHAQSKEEKEKNRMLLSTSIEAVRWLNSEEILNIMANRVRQMVREEVGDKYFCILVDEARDISKREQMAIILSFVNNHGILTEKIFAIKSVSDTTSINLKNEISNVLVHHDLHVKKIRGQ
ncbi:uncharacterized protein [Primulina eburnea]|uniref:uncharacterized protein n=1 Tax=Primulina eburnea TaxID=1245227 RepID=UPI003C6C8D35